MAAKPNLSTRAADILVVDDSIASLRMLTEILTQEGYKIRPVEESQLALEAALAQPPSLILLDVKMPKMSGFEVCRRLKQDERTRDVPIIFVSALEELQDRIQGFEVGGVDFISKPIQEAEVLARVRTHLRLRDTQLHLEELVAERTTELEKLLQERSLALSSAEDQTRTLFESSPLGIGLSTYEGQPLAANPAMLRMTGYAETEILQLDLTTLYDDPAQRAFMLEQLQKEHAVRDFGAKLRRKDGTTFYASMSVSAIQRDGQDALLTVVEDVTAEILAEAALTKANASLHTLLDSTRSITASLELDPLLELTLDHLGGVADYDSASIWIREGDRLVMRASRAPESAPSPVGRRVTLAASATLREMMETREAFIVDDTLEHRELVQDIMNVFGPPSEYDERTGTSWLGVPLVTKDQVIGVTSLVYGEPGHYTRAIADLVQALVNQAAIAIENARLHRQVQETATLEERARLARELHDAVTQTLFSAGLLADTTPRIWEKDQAMARQNLNQLSRLLRGALAEMRTLLYELRPEAVQNQTLGQLLDPLAEAARARTRAMVSLDVHGDRVLPGDVTTALFRIAQEALNNVAKHAEATKVDVTLTGSPEGVVLRITDDGRGFDPAGIPPGHLGVSIMGDRAQQVGAVFEIESQPGSGTQVIVTWSEEGEGDTHG